MTARRARRAVASKKVTISLPGQLFAELERSRRRKKIDRSSWIQKAVSEAVERDRRAENDLAYAESYRKDPEVVSAEEIAMVSRLAAAAWADLDE